MNNRKIFIFDVDGKDILDIDDSGINLASGKTFRVNGSAISSGDFTGPGSSTDNAIVRFDGTGGKTGQSSSILIDDSNNMAGVVSLASAADSALTIKADTDLIFKIDADNDGTETYQFQNGGGSNVMTIDESSNVTATTFVGNVTGNVTGNTSGTAATVTGASQSAITSLGTLTTLTVDDVVVDGKVITMTGSTSDTATITVGTNGTLAIATTDAAANAGNITITADGSIGLDSVTDMGFDAATGIFTFSDGGTEVLRLTEGNSGDVTIKTAVDGKDLIFTDNGDATNMKILDAAAGINVPGEVQTTGIGYTDGDNAITIADGGGITAAAGITSTAASNSFGASSFSGVLDITDATDSSDASGDTGALRTEGGASIAKKLFVGTDLDVDGTAEVDVLTIDGTAIVAQATTSAVGGVELATTAETTAGSDAARVITPDGLAGSVIFGTRYVQCVVFDFGTDIAEGNGKFYLHIPAGLNGMNLVEVHSEIITAGNGSTVDVQLHNVTHSADMLSTTLTIDSTETGSDTAATAAVINTSEDDVATNDLIRIDVDGNGGDTTIAKGLIVTLGFRLP